MELACILIIPLGVNVLHARFICLFFLAKAQRRQGKVIIIMVVCVKNLSWVFYLFIFSTNDGTRKMVNNVRGGCFG